MIGQYLKEGFHRYRDRDAVVHGGDHVTYGDIGELLLPLTAAWTQLADKRVGVCIAAPMPFVVAIATLDLLGSHAFLVGPRSKDEIERLKQIFHWDHVLYADDVLAAAASKNSHLGSASAGAGLVTLLTSGTTGAPKAVNHSWSSLASPVRKAKRYTGSKWLLAYPLNLYAGTQVFLHAFLNWATLVIPESFDPHEVGRTLKENRVTHASGTPTFWRQLLCFSPKQALQACELEQITLGGEVVAQDLLDNLHLAFPRARIVHIYASTELGRMFSVTDGREGFPVEYLHESPEEGVELRIVDGEVFARGRNAMISYDRQTSLGGYSEGWLATGDLVEICGNRVLFKGRRNDVINVGGRKVSPLKVESTLREVPGIIDIRVYAKKNSVTGQLVAADVVLAPGIGEERAGAELRRVASQTLEPHEVPRMFRVVQKMASNEALKVIRREQAE